MFLSVTCSASDIDDDDIKIINHVMPMRNELLPDPIYLSKNCSNIKIIEWRDFDDIDNKQFVINKLNYFCNKAVQLFPEYVKDNGLDVNFTIPSSSISFIPEDNKYRSLNDFEYRFRMNNLCDEYGRKCRENENPVQIVGLFIPIFKTLFMTNKIDHSFYITFSHEMFHILSNTSGLKRGLTSEQEERLAYNFELYMLNN
jgi:hypothetical protein